MANRFFNLPQTQYVDPYVAPPIEMLYGMLQQKQAGYDKVASAIDESGDLIKGDVMPGDQKYFQAIKNQYNQDLAKVRDSLMETKNTSQAARDLMKIRKSINENSNLQTMFSLYKPWVESEKQFKKDRQEGKVSDWNIINDPYTISSFNPETGKHEAIPLQFHYTDRGQDLRKELNDAVSNIAISKYGATQKSDGLWVSEKGEILTRDKIEAIYNQAEREILPRYQGEISRRGAYEAKLGRENPYEWYDQMKESIINPKIVKNKWTEVKESERSNIEFAKRLSQASDFMIITGQTTPVRFSAVEKFNELTNLKQQKEDLNKQLKNNNNLLERGQIQNNLRNIESQISYNENLLKFAAQTFKMSDNGNKLYDDYISEIKSVNAKLTDSAKHKNVYSKEEFYKIISGEYGKVQGSANILKGDPNQRTFLEKYQREFYQQLNEVTTKNAFEFEQQILMDINPSSDFNRFQNNMLDNIFNSNFNAITTEASSNPGMNIDTLIKSKYKNANKKMSNIATIMNPLDNQPEFKLEIRDKDGKLLGTEIIRSSKDSEKVKGFFNRNMAQQYFQSSADIPNQENILESMAKVNHGKELTLLQQMNLDSKPITSEKPIQISGYYIHTDENNPNIYYIASDAVKTNQGYNIMSNTYQKVMGKNTFTYKEILQFLGSKQVLNYR